MENLAAKKIEEIENNNPFKVLQDAYDETVKEIDKTSSPELFKTTFEKIVAFLNSINYHCIDIEYLDGYFLFGMGTNSVIHFHIKECPGWKFAIWWDIKNKEAKYSTLKGEFFCMHERYLDKFKPTRAEYLADLVFSLEEDWSLSTEKIDKFDLYKALDIIEFIHKHPYLAYHREITSDDYNCTKQRPIYSFFEYYKDSFDTWRRKFIQNYLNKKSLAYHVKKMYEYFPDTPWMVNDTGKDSSPRYDFLIFEEVNGDEDKLSPFAFFTDEDEPDWKKYKAKLNKISKLFGAYWYDGVSDCIDVVDINFIKDAELREYFFKGEECLLDNIHNYDKDK